MATGDLIKLGTLYVGDVKKARPVNPKGGGDSVRFTFGKIEIRNTETADADKMQWREVNDSGVKYFVGDRVYVHSISWDELHNQSLIQGKQVVIDGRNYKLRSLTGGSSYRNAGNANLGAYPVTNEWDRWIVNEAGLLGLPVPTSEDLVGRNPTGAHNLFWNWDYMYTWAQEAYSISGSNRAIRGHVAARQLGFTASSATGSNIGWRPVLEALNNAPVVSGTNTSLGVKSGAFTYDYTVTDSDGTVVKIQEKLNGAVLNTYTNLESGIRTFSVSKEQLKSLSFFKNHTMQIVATDDKGANSARTLTFTRGTEDLPQDASLKDIADSLTGAILYKRDSRTLIRDAITAKGGSVPEATPTPPQLVDGVNSIPKLVSTTGTIGVNNGDTKTVTGLPFEPDHVHVWYEWNNQYLGQSIASRSRLAANPVALITGNSGISISAISGNSFTFYFGISVSSATANWAAYKLL